MSLYLPKTIKERTEDYLRQNNPRIEHGGYFLGQRSTILIPRFYPNRADTPKNTYSMDPAAADYLKIDTRLFGMDLVVNFHTHPNHSISSENDVKYARQQSLTKLNVKIAYNAGEDAFTWNGYDNSALIVPIIIVTEDYPIFRELFAQSLRLISLGDCFLTPDGELLANNEIAKVVVNVDAEGLKVYNYFQAKRHVERETYTTVYKSATRIATELGMTLDRLRGIINRLQVRGVKVDLPNHSKR